MPVRHVLVVDDSKSARLMLRKMLQGFGMTVDTVESAEEALNYLRDQQPDAIFMDHTMPGMDGLTVVRQIKNSPATVSIPVAMYTSKDEPSYQDEARAAGAVGVLSKPAVPETLGAILEQLNALFDAAHAPPPSPPEPVTAAPATEGVTANWVSAIALEKAEQVFYESIETQVLPLINDVVAKLRRDVEASQQETCSRVATRICAEQLAAWRPPEPREVQPSEAALRAQMLPLMEERLETYRREARADLEELVREMAGQVCQHQLHDLSGRLVRQLSQRFTEAAQKAGADAREAAVRAARDVAAQATTAAAEAAAKSAAGQATAAAAAAEQTTRQLWADAQRDLRRYVHRAAGWAAVAGIGAAVLAYVLR